MFLLKAGKTLLEIALLEKAKIFWFFLRPEEIMKLFGTFKTKKPTQKIKDELRKGWK